MIGVYCYYRDNKPVNEKIRQSKIGEKNLNFGNIKSWDHINKNLIKCPVCVKMMTKGNFIRWGHRPNCKNGFC